MYIVMFHFVVKDGCEKQFLNAWPTVTQGIYLFKGSLGSRLHKDETGKFIAYAQWSNKQTYEQAQNIEMSDKYEQTRLDMHQALNLDKTEVIYQMEVEIDYLQRRPFAV